ncbi:MAG: ABC transporter permease [Clostridia bacterium]|nr:ABC transporter permease [Clostridia bacterium]
MFNLIRNESMKHNHRISTWIMTGLLIFAVIGAGLLLKFGPIPDGNETDWKVKLSSQNADFKRNLSDPRIPDSLKKSNEIPLKINEYRLEKDIPPIPTKSLWSFVTGVADLIKLIALFVIIAGALTVATEFSTGSIKLLVIRPVKRWKILLSKYIHTMLYALELLIILFAFSFLVGGILFGFKGISTSYVAYVDGNIIERNMFIHLFGLYGLKCVELVIMATFAFMLSTVFRSSALAIGLALFLTFTGGTIVTLLSSYNWVKYILFANTDLSQYFEGTPIVKGMTMGFSVSMLLIYFAIFNFVSWFTFNKRDISSLS